MIRTCCLILLCASVSTAELALGQPLVLDVHPDGGRLLWRLEVPAGDHVVVIDEALDGTVEVRGASWRLRQETIEVPAPDEPAGFVELVSARNQLAIAVAELQARQQAHEVLVQRVAERSAGRADAGDLVAVAGAINAAVTQQGVSDAQRLHLEREARSLERLAMAMSDGRGAWLAIPDVHAVVTPVTLTAARQAWRGRIPATRQRRVLDLTSTAIGVVNIVVHVPMRWSPAATVHIDGERASLIRRFQVSKPTALALTAVPVRLHSQRLGAAVWTPPVPGVRLAAESVQPIQAKTVGSELRATDIPVVHTLAIAQSEAGGSGALMEMEAPVTVLTSTPPTPSAPITQQPGFGVTWDLGTVDLPRGTTSTEHGLPPVAVRMISDEWALIPRVATVAIRRCIIELDDQPLFDGPLTVITDGRQRGTMASGNRAPGERLELRADDDATIFAAPAIPWDIAERDQTATRRREGSVTSIHHFGQTSRTVAYYALTPVSSSTDLTIERDAQTTGGAVEVAPGILRWHLDLAPNSQRDLSCGWVLQASGGLRF